MLLLPGAPGLAGALARTAATFRGATAYRQVILVFESLVKVRPRRAAYRRLLAALHNDLAVRLWRSGRLADARAAGRAACAIQERLTELRPSLQHRRLLARMRSNLAILEWIPERAI